MSLSDDLKAGAAFVKKYLPTVLEVGEKIAAVMPVGAEVVSAIKLASQVATGLVAAEPALVAVYDEIKAAADGDAAPTQEQWDAWNAAADQAHADLQAAVAAASAS